MPGLGLPWITMPLTAHGKRVQQSMRAHYGQKKGDSVFYAMANSRKGGRDKIGGVRIHKGAVKKPKGRSK